MDLLPIPKEKDRVRVTAIIHKDKTQKIRFMQQQAGADGYTVPY